MRSYGYKIPSQRSRFHYHNSYSMEQPNPDDCSPTQWYEYLRNPDAVTSDGDLTAQVFDLVSPPYATQPPTPVTLPDGELPQEIICEPSPAHAFYMSNSPPDSVDPGDTFDASNSPPGAIDLEHLHGYELEGRISPPTSIATPPPATFLPPGWYRIPQTVYDFGTKQYDFEPLESIIFHVDGCPGQNMGDALRNQFPGLCGRDDLVLQEARGAISCRMSFPGYPASKAMQICTTYYNKDRNPITRSKLACDVAKKLLQYLDLMRTSHVIDVTTNNLWTIGEGFMHLDNMYLSELESVSKGSFQPTIWVRVTGPGTQGN